MNAGEKYMRFNRSYIWFIGWFYSPIIPIIYAPYVSISILATRSALGGIKHLKRIVLPIFLLLALATMAGLWPILASIGHTTLSRSDFCLR